ncbi:MAG TPA: ACP phosphodiesterase [Burkholderiaceae bacterium]|jgi:acyl carrier protein phosphodiesterase|nr:ACP phosphodiesterase [Burkholderiaceae bacterium]
MNYLAHIFLARQSDHAMLGALLGDFAKADVTGKFGREIEREILIHRKVDIYTDSHPVVVAAREYFDPVRRRYAGIVLDMFYDHVLAKNWATYCETPLGDFVANFYRVLRENFALLPERLAYIAPKMIEQDWLGSYRDYSAVELAVTRTSSRLSRNGDLLRDGLIDVQANYAALGNGFHEFFHDLIRYTETYRASVVDK